MQITNSDRPVVFYDLDVIISVGYRVKSQAGVQFRRWATKVSHDYTVEGVAINQNRLNQLNKILEITNRSEIAEVSGVANVIKNYAQALNWLAEYDENKLAQIYIRVWRKRPPTYFIW